VFVVSIVLLFLQSFFWVQLHSFFASVPLTRNSCHHYHYHPLSLLQQQQVYTRSGYPSLDARRGRRSGSEYQLAPRALILRRDHAAVQSVSQLKRLLRSNGYDTTTSKSSSGGSTSSSSKGTRLPRPLNDGMQGRTEDLGDPFASDSPWSAVRTRICILLNTINLFSESQSWPLVVSHIPSVPIELDSNKEQIVLLSLSPEQRTHFLLSYTHIHVLSTQVCSRGDLDPIQASLEGCYDSKATSAALFFAWPDDAVERDRLLGQGSAAATGSSSSSDSGSSHGNTNDDTNLLSDDKDHHHHGNRETPLLAPMPWPMPWPMGVWAINGPTAQGQEPFSWANVDAVAGAEAEAGRAANEATSASEATNTSNVAVRSEV